MQYKIPIHSDLIWSLDSDPNETIIKEIVRVVCANRVHIARFRPWQRYEPKNDVDQLAYDAAELIDLHGFTDAAIFRYAAKDESHRKKKEVVMFYVRGTLHHLGLIGARKEKKKNG